MTRRSRRRSTPLGRCLQAAGTLAALVLLGLALTGLGEIALKAVGAR
jgi:hypothetical protein